MVDNFIWEAYINKEYSQCQVGPIPVDDGIGKEVVTQITSNIQNNKIFYTDSSGRDFIERVWCLFIEI